MKQAMPGNAYHRPSAYSMAASLNVMKGGRICFGSEDCVSSWMELRDAQPAPQPAPAAVMQPWDIVGMVLGCVVLGFLAGRWR